MHSLAEFVEHQLLAGKLLVPDAPWTNLRESLLSDPGCYILDSCDVIGGDLASDAAVYDMGSVTFTISRELNVELSCDRLGEEPSSASELGSLIAS